MFLETLPIPQPINNLINKDLLDALNTRLSSEKQKEHNDENNKVVKRLKALLA